MTSNGSRWRTRLQRESWVCISLLGLLALSVPLYDMWDDVSNLSWGVSATLVENSVLLLLAFGLLVGGYVVGTRDWDPKYVWTVTKWNLGVTAAILALYGAVIGLQLWVMGSLKPWILALDGAVFGSVTAFGVGVYNAERERARDDLERSREEYRTLTEDVLDTSDVATLIFDEDDRVVWTNAAVESYFGIDRQAVVGNPKSRVLGEQVAAQLERPERFIAAMPEDGGGNDGETQEFECHSPAENGAEERWFRYWSRPVENGLYEGGRIEQFTDITDLKRRERELDTRERSLREMYDAISDTSLAFEEQVSRIVEIGRDLLGAEYGAFARIDEETSTYAPRLVSAERPDADVGLDADELVPLAETYCARMVDAGRTVQLDSHAVDTDADGAGGGPDEQRDAAPGEPFETYVGTPVETDGTLYGSLCFLDRNAAEEFDGWQLTMVELMGNWVGYELERRQLLAEREQELHDRESMVEELVETVDNYAIFTLDTAGRITTWNTGAERIKGYGKEEIVGSHIRTFYPEAKRDEHLPERLLAEAERTGQANHVGWRLRKDGTAFWADVTIAARYDADGRHVGFMKITKDLTERRAHEQRLQEQREHLEFLNRIIRHNILNGLNLLNARLQIIDEHDDETTEHVETMLDRIDDLSGLIQTMRAFMDAVLADAEYRTEPVPLREELTRKVTLARRSYPDAVFETHDLPDEGTMVRADELIGEVFENVLSNAVVHNDTERPRVEVWTTATTLEVTVDAQSDEANPGDGPPDVDSRVETHEAVCVHIADNGPGIPDEEKEHTLEKGVSELSEPGNGFGLYLVTEMMDTYGGTVDIRDNEGGGTVFDLTFLRE